VKILFVNNKGGGFAGQTEVPANTTVAQFFDERITGRPDDYLIRVNRQTVPSDYVLQEGDRVTITPIRIEGAA
jgi:sulfur carrier protein ThiS